MKLESIQVLLDASSIESEIKDSKKQADNAAQTASNYISASSSGIRIASANPATQNQRLELTNSKATFYDSGNTQRLALDSSNGVVVGNPSKGRAVINDAGMTVYDTNNKKRTAVDSNGLHAYDTDGSTEVAVFGATVRIGKASSGHAKVESDGLRVFDANKKLRLEATTDGLILNAPTTYTNTETNNTGTTQIAKIGVRADVVRWGSGHAGGAYYMFCDDTDESAYYSNSFTPGSYGFMEGNHTKAQGAYSHAEGCYTYAKGHRSHAEGCTTLAGVAGTSTSALGNGYAHAEGHASQATGKASHAQNESTIAAGTNQTAIGRFNVKDAAGTYAFIIGNGSSTVYEWPGSDGHGPSLAEWAVKSGTVTRSNALTVDWNGCIRVQDQKLITRATVDKDNITVTKNSANSDISISAKKDGYTPVGIIGFNVANASSSGVNCSHCNLYKMRLNGTNVEASVRNTASSDAKIHVYAYILYIANGQGL